MGGRTEASGGLGEQEELEKLELFESWVSSMCFVGASEASEALKALNQNRYCGLELQVGEPQVMIRLQQRSSLHQVGAQWNWKTWIYMTGDPVDELTREEMI